MITPMSILSAMAAYNGVISAYALRTQFGLPESYSVDQLSKDYDRVLTALIKDSMIKRINLLFDVPYVGYTMTYKGFLYYQENKPNDLPSV